MAVKIAWAVTLQQDPHTHTAYEDILRTVAQEEHPDQDGHDNPLPNPNDPNPTSGPSSSRGGPPGSTNTRQRTEPPGAPAGRHGLPGETSARGPRLEPGLAGWV